MEEINMVGAESPVGGSLVVGVPPVKPVEDLARDFWREIYGEESDIPACPWLKAVPVGFIPIYIHPDVGLKELAQAITELALPSESSRNEYASKMVLAWVELNKQILESSGPFQSGWFLTETDPLSLCRGKLRKSIHAELSKRGATMMDIKAYLAWVLWFYKTNKNWPDTTGSTELATIWQGGNLLVGWGSSGNFHADKRSIDADAPYTGIGVRSLVPSPTN
ncbi:MAG: hypothetical protein V1719_01830 [Patescibacteria group bacterium]